MSTPDLTRYDQFLAISPEDIQARDKLGLTQADLDILHTCAVKGEVTWDYYHAVNNASKADFVYLNDEGKHGWSIAFIREQLGRKEYRQYSQCGEEVREWIYGRIFPIGLYVRRIRTQQDPIRIIDELELALSPESDLEGLWKRQRKEFEVSGINLIQQFPDNEFVRDICYLPGDPNFECRLIISAGTQRKELIFPIALRYKPLLMSLERQYTVDDTQVAINPKQALQQASTEELQEALLGLWCAVRNYDSTKDLPIPGYIKTQLGWHMGDVYANRSDIIDDLTGKPQRLLKSEIERTGGSLDGSIPSHDVEGARTLGDTIPDRQSVLPDAHTLLAQIIDSLTDETDKQIVHLMLLDIPQKDIGKQLKMSQSAISQRLKRMGKRLGA